MSQSPKMGRRGLNALRLIEKDWETGTHHILSLKKYVLKQNRTQVKRALSYVSKNLVGLVLLKYLS